ncbi:unnamed protein product [Auanema sp. JU1783]|nr:unnamed protein product [Auanema sp. JU1783]
MSVAPRRARPRSCKFKLYQITFFLQNRHINFLENHIQDRFRRLGLFIGSNPALFICISLVLSLLSIGCYNIRFAQNLQDGFVAKTSMARVEQAVKAEFDGEQTSKVQHFVILVRRADGGNILDRNYYTRLKDLHDHIVNNISVTIDGTSYVHTGLQGKYTNINILLWQLINCLDGVYNNSNVYLDHPQSRLFGYPILIAPHAFGITRKSKSEETELEGNLGQAVHVPYNSINSFPDHSNRTGIKEVKMISMYFSAPIPDDNTTNIITKWESAVFKWAYSENREFQQFRIDVMGDKILGQEMIRGGLSLLDYLAFGIAVTIIFVLIIIIFTFFAAGRKDFGWTFVVIGMIASPMIAIIMTFGFIHGILEVDMYPTIMVIPFLILAIGVDDAFLMNGAFIAIQEEYRTTEGGKGHTVVALIFSKVLESVGPSITITSLTNAIAFGIGMLTDSPAVQVFCLSATVAIIFDYILEIILFGSMLVLSGRCYKSCPSTEPLRENMTKMKKSIIRWYSHLLTRSTTRICVVTATLLFFIFSLYQAVTIEIQINSQKIIPKDSVLLEADRLFREYYWKEYEPLYIYVNNPPATLNQETLSDLKAMINDFETMPRSIGNKSTVLWLTDYEKAYQPLYDFHNLWGDFPLSYDELSHFLEETPARHIWSNFVHWHRNQKGDTVVDSFHFMTGIHNGTTWEERASNMLHWRDVAEKWKRFNVTVFSENSAVFEGIHGIPRQTIMATLLTLFSMIIVCLIFIPSIVSVMFAAFAILNISICVIGFLHWTGFNLDPVTQASILMSIGFSVDFTAHISFHFQSAWSRSSSVTTTQEVLERTFDAVGIAMLESAASTVACFVPPAWHSDYTPRVFVVTVFFLVAYGALFGLFILPTILAMFSRSFYILENPYHNVVEHDSMTVMIEGKPDVIKEKPALDVPLLFENSSSNSSEKDTTSSLLTSTDDSP